MLNMREVSFLVGMCDTSRSKKKSSRDTCQKKGTRARERTTFYSLLSSERVSVVLSRHRSRIIRSSALSFVVVVSRK